MIHVQFVLSLSVKTKSGMKLMGMKKLMSSILPFKHFENYMASGRENLYFDTRPESKPEKTIIKTERP